MPPTKEKASNQNIFVAVRCRPMNDAETAERCYSVIDTDSENRTVVVRERPQTGSSSKTYTFDKVFGTRSKQVDVYNAVVKPAIDEVIAGYNCTIFVYGQTGTGKTFTMEGERSAEHLRWEDDPMAGIVPRSLAHLFETLESMDCEFSMRASYLELYNEELFDLLGATECDTKMRIYEDASRKGSVVIQGLEEVVVRNKHEVYNIMKRGSQRRQTASTILNATSSRSHTVFTVTIHLKENTVDGEELVKTGKLNLVDLAGSENIGRSGAVDKRAREAGNINQSLLTLGRVITALVDRKPHVPYRESKLTRILQDSLGGKTKTSIIATISPANSNFEETLSTLEYAHRAKNIQNNPEVNQKLTKKNLIKEYNEEIERLRKDLQSARDKNGIYLSEENYREMQHQLASQADLLKTQDQDLQSLNKDHVELTDTYAKTVDVLKATQTDLEKTSTELEATKNTLEKTKSRLAKAYQQVDEQSYLLELHRVNEEKLTQEGTSLLQTVDVTVDHISKLHSASDRRKETEKSNFSKLSEYRSSFEKEINQMMESVRDLCDKQHQLSMASTSILGEINTASKEILSTQTSNLHSLKVLVMAESGGLIEEIVKLQSAASSTAEHIPKTTESFQDKLKQLQEKFSGIMLVNIQKELTQRQNNLKDVIVGLESNNDSLVCELEKQQQELLAKTEMKLSSFAEEFTNVTSQMLELKQYKSQTEEAYSQITSIDKEIMELSDKRRQLSTTMYENTLAVDNKLMTSINSCQDSVNSMAQAFPEVLKHFVVESEKAVKIAKDEVQEHISKYGVESQAVVNIQNRLNSEVEAVNKECQAEMALYTNSVTSHLKDLDRTAYSIVEQAKATNQTFVDSVSAKVADITTTLTEADAASLAATNRLSDITSERANLLSAYSDVSVSSYKDATNKLDKLVGTDMKEYQSSGGTPTKTNYEHVTDITPALPRAELLATFRADSQSSKEDMAARLELPLTDSEEEEVPPVAIEQDESNTSVDDLKESSDKENIAEVVGGVSTRRRGGGIPRSNKAPSTSSAKSYPSTSGKGKNPTTSRSQASKTVKRKIPEVPDHPKKQSRNNP